MIVINAEGKILGRLAAFAAKQALLGEEVRVVNCEKAVVTGSPKRVLEDYRRKRERGVPRKGPFFPKQSDRLVRRTIRGMLPYKKPRGAEAFKRVMCYKGVPFELEGKPFTDVPGADASKLKNLKYLEVQRICKELGGS